MAAISAKKLLHLAACLLFLSIQPLSALTIGGLEFEPPVSLEGWEFVTETEDGIVFNTYGRQHEKFTEIFMMAYREGYTTDIGLLKEGLGKVAEEMARQVSSNCHGFISDVQIGKESIFYKTTISTEKKNTMYNWGRDILTKEGWVQLHYIIREKDLQDEAFCLTDNGKITESWVKFLKEGSFKNKRL